MSQRDRSAEATKHHTAESPKARTGLRGFLDRTGTPELVILALTVGISVWAWLAFVVGSPQNVEAFGWLFLGVNLGGATAQLILAWFVRAQGTFRDRVTGSAASDTRRGSWIVFVGPAVVYAVVFLIVTPPSTPARDIEYGWNIYQAIGLFVMLGLLASACSILVYVAALPILFLIDGLLPARKVGQDPMSRGEYLGGGVLLLGIFGFAISMQFIAPALASTHSSRERMGLQFWFFVTLHGAPVPTIIAVLCIAAIVVGIIVNNRGVARRRRAWVARISQQNGAPKA
jgi:hypothetical protein